MINFSNSCKGDAARHRLRTSRRPRGIHPPRLPHQSPTSRRTRRPSPPPRRSAGPPSSPSALGGSVSMSLGGEPASRALGSRSSGAALVAGRIHDQSAAFSVVKGTRSVWVSGERLVSGSVVSDSRGSVKRLGGGRTSGDGGRTSCNAVTSCGVVCVTPIDPLF